VVMYVLTRVHVVKEEENLEAQFGREYADYRRRVGSIFPRLFRRR
jgi:protein-S-isoprenylcysteine O-methyltransferase Ste14